MKPHVRGLAFRASLFALLGIVSYSVKGQNSNQAVKESVPFEQNNVNPYMQRAMRVPQADALQKKESQRSMGTTCSPGNPCNFTRPGSEIVKDGSFEVNKCCPQGYDELNNPSSACFWDAPTTPTPDYFHSCGSADLGVPNNFANGMYAPAALRGPVYALGQDTRALTGNAYAGIIAFGSPDTPTSGTYNEYVRQTLDATLVSGKRYYGEFSAYLAPGSILIPTLGMALADHTFLAPYSNSTLLPISAQVSGSPNLAPDPTSGVIPSGWKRIGQVFTAATSSNLTSLVNPDLVVGFFGTGHRVTNGSNNASYISPYYYIDNVSLSPLTEAGPAYTTTICDQTTTFTLGTLPMPNVVDAHYQWSASPADASLSAAAAQTANPQVSPNQTTTYTLAVTINGQSYTSSTTVTVNYIPATAGQDKLICSNSNVTLGEGCSVPGATYGWQELGSGYTFTSAFHPTFPVSQTTTYVLTVHLPDGTSSQSQVHIQVFDSDYQPSYNLIDTNECGKIYTYQINDFNPNFFTYTVHATGVTVMGQPSATTQGVFRLKGGGNSTGGTFTLTATACGTSATSDLDGLTFNCSQPTPIYRTAGVTAFPNPVGESLTVPEGAENATLLNSAGKPVQKANAFGKLDVQSLPDGLYNLQMMQNGKFINQRIQVKH